MTSERAYRNEIFYIEEHYYKYRVILFVWRRNLSWKSNFIGTHDADARRKHRKIIPTERRLLTWTTVTLLSGRTRLYQRVFGLFGEDYK